jgi:hypothetical protein
VGDASDLERSDVAVAPNGLHAVLVVGQVEVNGVQQQDDDLPYEFAEDGHGEGHKEAVSDKYQGELEN